jgi:aerobic carbon-monoxide dehydrogenase small subunit
MRVPLSVTVNGIAHSVEVDTRSSLATMLRDDLGLTGTHVGCRSGNCGACTVSLDGDIVKSCCVLAPEMDGAAIETIEAVAPSAGELHPVQRAFVAEQALQCGFCTPGMIMAVVDLLRRNPDPTDREIRAGLAGNLCRCTGYAPILRAVHAAAREIATDFKGSR